jgi:hypothetical protein
MKIYADCMSLTLLRTLLLCQAVTGYQPTWPHNPHTQLQPGDATRLNLPAQQDKLTCQTVTQPALALAPGGYDAQPFNTHGTPTVLTATLNEGNSFLLQSRRRSGSQTCNNRKCRDLCHP